MPAGSTVLGTSLLRGGWHLTDRPQLMHLGTVAQSPPVLWCTNCLSLFSECIFLSMFFCEGDNRELLSKHLARILALCSYVIICIPGTLGVLPSASILLQRSSSAVGCIVESRQWPLGLALIFTEAKSTCSKQLRQDGESSRAPILETDVKRNSTKEKHKRESNNNN